MPTTSIQNPHKKIYRRWLKAGIAASLFVVFGGAYYFINGQKQNNVETPVLTNTLKADTPPNKQSLKTTNNQQEKINLLTVNPLENGN